MRQPRRAPAPQAPRKPKKKSMLKDPVVRWLVHLRSRACHRVLRHRRQRAAHGSSRFVGAQVQGRARPSESRPSQTQASPKDTAVWRQYVLALLADRQFSQGAERHRSAPRCSRRTGSEDMLLAQAELYYAKKDYKQAIKTADEVRTKLQKPPRRGPGDEGRPQGHDRSTTTRGRHCCSSAKRRCSSGRHEAALKSYDEYLAEFKTVVRRVRSPR